MKLIPLITTIVAVVTVAGGVGFLVTKKNTAKTVNSNLEIPNRGSIQILNGCGSPGAGQIVADILRNNRFDVKEIGNAPDWNYRHTIVARRSMDTLLAFDVAKALGTTHLIPLQNNMGIYDITVFVGADYRDLAKKE